MKIQKLILRILFHRGELTPNEYAYLLYELTR